jgi:hypothetical protein
MTGIRVRIHRGGEWQDVEVDEIAPDEWPTVAMMARRFGLDGWDVVRALVEWIRRHPPAGPAQAT